MNCLDDEACGYADKIATYMNSQGWTVNAVTENVNTGMDDLRDVVVAGDNGLAKSVLEALTSKGVKAVLADPADKRIGVLPGHVMILVGHHPL